jgi:hypothetical protein
MRDRQTRRAALCAIGGGALAWALPAQEPRNKALLLRARSRVEQPEGSGIVQTRQELLRWKTGETAIIICDMWDNHYCQNAARRVKAMAPRMNQVVKDARNLGVTSFHSPSGTMYVYEGTPLRSPLKNVV